MSEKDKAEARAIQALLEFRDAKANGKSTTGPLSRFEDALDLVDVETRERLENALGALELVAADKAFTKFGELTDDIRAIKDGFSLGEQIAQAGQRALFFPAAATHLGQLAGLVKSLNVAANTIKEHIDEVQATFRQKDAERLVKDGTALQESLEELVNAFKEIKSLLPVQ